MRKTMFREGDRRDLLARLQGLSPQSPRRWGTMTAPRMVTHLIDQMRYTLGDIRVSARPGLWRFQPLKLVALYLLPWPKGRIDGPPELFVTRPSAWETDLTVLHSLIDRFVERDPGGAWPDHPLIGRLSGRHWGVFVHRHFDHHFRQFGV